MNRSLLVLGMLLLGGTVGGVLLLLNHSSGSHGDKVQATAPPASDTPEYIAGLGHVDVEHRIKDLYPRQPGLVIKVAAENDKVEKGDVLLQIDDRLAQRQLEEAKIALRAAETSHAMAEIAAKKYPHLLEQQTRAVAAAEHKFNALSAEKRQMEKEIKANFKPSPEKETALKEGVAHLEELVKVEKAKLAELKETEPLQKLKVDQAADDVDAKKVLVKKAEDALEMYQVVAPCAGSVLRLLTSEGETLGSNPREPAMKFRPAGPLVIRAEVLQDWGPLVKLKQKVEIEDETDKDRKWTGEVQHISDWYAPTRSPVIEPFKMNDVRTLECIIKITSPEQGMRIWQRVRVKIKTNPA